MRINLNPTTALAPAIGLVLAYDSGGYFAGIYHPYWLGYVVAGLFPASILVLGRWQTRRALAWVLIFALFVVESLAAGLHLAQPVAAQGVETGHLTRLEELSAQAVAEAQAFAAQGQKTNLARRSEELAALRSQIIQVSANQTQKPTRGLWDWAVIISSRLVLGLVLVSLAGFAVQTHPVRPEPQNQPMATPTDGTPANPGDPPVEYRPLPPRGPNGKFMTKAQMGQQPTQPWLRPEPKETT